ncbi:CPCC family cysteine-rich protein [Sorangium sp. So ce341]|uniref:CPCC family cysteine-rich protein n=1 Tax=Sorangium sp. So ce341 TaxID=3133302 RepID=UPI003F64633C
MSYRRERSDPSIERTWRVWLEAHRGVLASSGLPLDLYSSRVAWEDFLSTGNAVFGSGSGRREFDFNALTVSQQQQLHDFLERVVGAEEPTPGLLGFLRVRAACGWQPPFTGAGPTQLGREPSPALAQCPCCDYFSLPCQGEYEICEVCFWEDDGGDVGDLDRYSGPNHMTLREGRDNFRRIGACDERALAHVLPAADRVRLQRVPR